MLTQTVTITQNSNPNIIIGRRSTYETQQVIFDVSWLVQTYGEGTAELLIKRPKDASAYPVVATLDGNTLTWTVSDTDTQDKGHGECEIYWYVNGGLAKSCICGITILRDIGDTTETAPDPYETWVDELARLGAETLANAQSAEQSATSAAQSATEADNSAAAALESEENALNSENAAKASEQAAAASEQGAEQSAMAARQSATEAAQSASAAESSAANAQESADNSSASADRAEQAAASIEGDTERAEAAARTAQGAATSAQGSASTASTKATEAAGSADTAEQAANTATQKAADASASATAAGGSASSASASATAAGNAKAAAETAQGKAEDAQEAAETAAASVAGKSAQIDQNTEDVADLKSALNTKAGILRDTVSGSVVSFAPDSTVPNLLGLDVHLEPIQDLHGYDSPWPAGGGKNKFGCADGTYAIGSTRTVIVADGVWTYRANVDATSGVFLPEATVVAMAIPALQPGTYTLSLASDAAASSVIASAVLNLADGQAIANGGTFTINESTAIVSITTPIIGQYDVGAYTCNIQIENGTSVTAWTPYSNLCPISGRESVEVEATGINIWDEEWEVVSNRYIRSKNLIPVRPSTTYAFVSPNEPSNGFKYYDADKNIINTVYSLNGSFTTPANCYYVWFAITSAYGAIYNHDISINYPSTDHDYHPYAGNRYTIQLGDMVYGGTLDVTKGVLTVDMVSVDLGTLDWGRYNFSGVFCFYVRLPNMKAEESYGLCESYEVVTSRSPTRLENGEMTLDNGGHSRYIYLRDDAFSDAATFKAAMSGVQLCYELDTPITIDLDPVTISTISGQTNNVWADAGDVSVEFAADLKTYIDNKIAAAVAAMS